MIVVGLHFAMNNFFHVLDKPGYFYASLSDGKRNITRFICTYQKRTKNFSLMYRSCMILWCLYCVIWFYHFYAVLQSDSIGRLFHESPCHSSGLCMASCWGVKTFFFFFFKFILFYFFLREMKKWFMCICVWMTVWVFCVIAVIPAAPTFFFPQDFLWTSIDVNCGRTQSKWSVFCTIPLVFMYKYSSLFQKGHKSGCLRQSVWFSGM